MQLDFHLHKVIESKLTETIDAVDVSQVKWLGAILIVLYVLDRVYQMKIIRKAHRSAIKTLKKITRKFRVELRSETANRRAKSSFWLRVEKYCSYTLAASLCIKGTIYVVDLPFLSVSGNNITLLAGNAAMHYFFAGLYLRLGDKANDGLQ